jgi:hypothetical protein
MTKLAILRQLIKEEIEDFKNSQPLTFESDPLEYILQKYPSLDATMTDLMTPYYRDYISGVFVTAPKPTTFRVVLHNGQEFYLIYGPKSYTAKISGKKYDLLNLSEEQFAITSIAQLLELGLPPGSTGPNKPEENQADLQNKDTEEAPAEEAPEETSPEEVKEGLKKKSKFYIKEASLSPAELEKPFTSKSEFKDQYDDRGERFLDKIKNQEPFELNDGTQIVLDPKATAEAIKDLQSKNYKTLGKGKVFIDTEGNAYGLSAFKKTPEFGSGAGQGGGAENTEIQESAQSVVNTIAYKILGKTISAGDLTPENLTAAYAISDVTAGLDSIIEYVASKKQWTPTFVNTANLLLRTFPSKSLQQHRGSSFVKSIYSAFNAAKKKADSSLNSDKWNPADIWMVDESILGMEFPTTFEELNGMLVELYNDRKLIGVSLKQLNGAGEIKVYNLDKDATKSYQYKGYDSRPTNNNTVLLYDDGSITFRTFNFAGNFAGEIKGKKAAGGKIGQGPINDVLRSNDLPLLPTAKNLQDEFKSNNQRLIDDFYQSYSTIVENISPEAFDDLVKSKDLNWLVSKYLSTKLAFTINSIEPDRQNEVISDMLSYASSSTKSSSVFVKVS